MEGNQAFIDMNRAFACRHCNKIAFEPFISQCCEVIMCQQCVREGIACPKCFVYDAGIKQSPLLLKIY